MVISETSEVAFRSSMKRLPQGGIMRDDRLRQDDAAERRRARLMLRAIVASHWPRCTAATAPRTTSAP